MRRTYHYDPALGKLVPGPAERRAVRTVDSSFYSDNPFKAHDGTIVNSKKKHRDYMRRHNLTTMDDFTNTWKDAEKQREKFYTGDSDHKERREDIERAFEKYSSS